MNDQAKIQRTLRLLMLLAGKRWYSPAEVEDRIGIGTRTLFRYLKTLETAGFVVERSPNGYRLAAEGGSMLTMKRLLHFTEEEAMLLYKTLGLLQGEGPAKERLLRKLHTLYDSHIISRPARQHTYEIVATLQKAINRKQQCQINQYRSSHSLTITNRLVEPFDFTENYDAIWAFEPESQLNKQFKIARFDSITLLPHAWQHSHRHAIPFTDAFGFASSRPKGAAHLRLSLRSANLLREEYPLAEKYIEQDGTNYIVKLPFADFKGIGRFIRGLREEIEVLGTEGLKKFVGR
jgi:predicted DNA-binding transcriptional regulator YafY